MSTLSIAPNTARWKGLSPKRFFKDKSVERIRQQFGKSGVRLGLVPLAKKKSGLPKIRNAIFENQKGLASQAS